MNISNSEQQRSQLASSQKNKESWKESEICYSIRHDDVGFGKWLSKSRVCWIFKEYSEDLGKKVHCHMLRHSFATFMLENDVSIRLIQELLWHKYITTTQSYVHISNSYAQREYDRVFKKQASY